MAPSQTKSPATDTDGMTASDAKGGVEAAYEAVGEALDELLNDDSVENADLITELQKSYFDLKAAALARDKAFQNIDLSGENIYIPNTYRSSDDNPTVETENGEWEIPTRDDNITILDGLQVADAKNPHVTRGVHIDHVFDRDGAVTVEVNGTPLDGLMGDNSGVR